MIDINKYSLIEKGEIYSVSISNKKGTKKRPVDSVFVDESGIRGDGHSGNWHRQVSLLSLESIKKVRERGINAKPGDFAENIITKGVKLDELKVGDILIIGDLLDSDNLNWFPNKSYQKELGENTVVLKVTQIGKECIHPCKIYYLMGSCIMPEEGIFCRVLKTGNIKKEDFIFVFRKEE